MGDRKTVRLSFSALRTLTDCGKKYEYQYIQKLVPKKTSSALLYGSAIDKAIESSLKGEDPYEAFTKKWEYGYINGKEEHLPTCGRLDYWPSDFDIDLLSESDLENLQLIRPDSIPGNIYEVTSEVIKLKKQEQFRTLRKDESKFYDLMCWLSLSQKGRLMIDAFNRDLKPEIAEVLSIQQKVEMSSDEGDSSVGYIDLVAKLKDGRIAVLDIKTASRPYEQDSVKNSPQLASYVFQVENQYNTRLAGFMVIGKKIDKDVTKVCTICGHVGLGTHKKCNAEMNGKRCNGEWNETCKLSAPTQFILDTIPETTEQLVIENYDNAAKLLKANLFMRNFNACEGKFGKCQYFNKCWGNSEEGLERLDSEKK